MLIRRPILAVAIATGLFGCAAKPKSAVPTSEPAPNQVYKAYIPTTKPTELVTEDGPKHPLDAQQSHIFFYSIDVWEVQMPRYSVSTDENFWKQVNEQALDLPSYDMLFKNGIRVGTIPLSDLGAVSQLIEDRKGSKTIIQGTAGRQMELPFEKDVAEEVLFYLDRSNDLVGRSYEHCDNFLAFSFETTPRNPDQIRLAFTPIVRAREKKLAFTQTPGKSDREISMVGEEKHYDLGLATDLPLQEALVIAPSVEAKVSTSIGARFLLINTLSEQRERLLVVVPHAYERAADAPPPG